MKKPKALQAGVWRKPSLRGHSVERCLRFGRGFRVYSSVERLSQIPHLIYVSNSFLGSIAGLENVCRAEVGDFEALRMRNGDVAFLTQAVHTEVALRADKQPPRIANRSLKALVASGSVVVSVALLGTLVGHSNEGFKDDHGSAVINGDKVGSTANIPVQTCASRMQKPQGPLKDFLEDGAPDDALKFEGVSRLRNGGIRSVKVRVNCTPLAAATIAGEAAIEQTWQGSLARNQSGWRVIKMAQLDN